jgi:hypothetical protein
MMFPPFLQAKPLRPVRIIKSTNAARVLARLIPGQQAERDGGRGAQEQFALPDAAE